MKYNKFNIVLEKQILYYLDIKTQHLGKANCNLLRVCWAQSWSNICNWDCSKGAGLSECQMGYSVWLSMFWSSYWSRLFIKLNDIFNRLIVSKTKNSTKRLLPRVYVWDGTLFKHGFPFSQKVLWIEDFNFYSGD